MTNHCPIVVETADGKLAHGMRHLHGVHTQYVNRPPQRVGHVFQGGYKAIFVEAENYLLELARIVVLNPVHAAMVESVQDWPWCSYLATVGDTLRPLWLQTDWVLGKFGTQRNGAVAGVHGLRANRSRALPCALCQRQPLGEGVRARRWKRGGVPSSRPRRWFDPIPRRMSQCNA